MTDSIELYMISGFLGAGKTTFLKRMINSFPNRKVGVLINEVGAVSIDTARVIREDLKIAEITNGSIYCACVKGDFIKALIALSAQDIDVLIIENSGMADPAGIHRVLDELTGKVSRPYHYRGCVCLTDGRNFLKRVKVLISVENQVRASSLILVNKTDLAGADEISRIHEALHAINPRAKICDTTYADIPVEAVDAFLNDNGFDEETTNRCTNKPKSYTLSFKGPVNEDRLSGFLKAVSDEMYRIKGTAETERGLLRVDTVDDTVNLVPEQDAKDAGSVLIFISKETDDEKIWLEQVWLHMCGISASVE